ncbi:CHASE2 domain-containing protein [Prosthecobacter sp.]|jgi:adenylate cyclase|uniref:CHASE2 domain-containing protein n=1 Tax=Prosthecobacter sp. TaxID=1965333 RepID=UPI003783D2AA
MKGLLLPKARAILGGLIGLFFALLAWGGLLDPLENLTIDYRLRLRKPRPVSDDVRLVGIGDRDVGSQLGRWPFPRAVHGDVLSILNAVGAKHITFDVLFTEPSADVSQDERLKTAIRQQANITLAYHFEQAETDTHAPGAEDRAHFLTDGSRFGLNVNDLKLVRGRLPVPPFEKLPVTYGAVNAVPDADGVIRRLPLFFAHEGRLYPSLALQTVMSALGLRDDQVSIELGKAVTLVDTPRGTLRVPIDEHGHYRVNFLGDLEVFTPAFEYLDLYQAVESKELGEQIVAAMKGRLALIGLVSTGNTDVVSSSIGRVPGVAVQATVVSNILTGDHLHFPPWWQQALFITGAGALLALCIRPMRPWLGILFFLIMIAAWAAGAVLAAGANLMLPVVPVLGVFGAATLGLLGLEAAAMKQDRTRVVHVLGRYIARPVLERLVNAEQGSSGATERRELTIFFSDIRGFTAWTERAEPDEVASRLNEYFAAMTPLIERHGGTLDKFIGDSVMVFFGAPSADDQHALHAVQMAMDMQHEMSRLNENWRKRGYDPLQIGIGIHTGYVNVGSFGSESFLDYTVIGRAVNLAARIESQAEGGRILVSARTHSILDGQINTVPHPDLVLKGIPEPQAVWEVIW